MYPPARLTGRLDLTALQQALDQLVARHEILRTRFVCSDGQPAQVVDEGLRAPVRFQDLQDVPESDRKSRAHAMVSEEANRPFDLETGPLIRAVLLCLQPDEHWFVLNLHHIVCDEWSLRLCFEELGELYAAARENRGAVLPELPIQYSDFALWQRDPAREPLFQEQLGYWRRQLQGNPPILELPADHPRPAEPSFRGETENRVLRAELTDGLKSVAAANESTLFMVFLAAFHTLLQRYTRQDDVMVGSPVAGRNRIETERLIGFFVNTVMLRTDLRAIRNSPKLLRRIRETTLGACAHADLPFEKVVEDLPTRTDVEPDSVHPDFFQPSRPVSGGTALAESDGAVLRHRARHVQI